MSTKPTHATKYGKPSIGCYLDHGNYSVDELNAKTVRLAESYGMPVDAKTLNLLEKVEDTDYGTLYDGNDNGAENEHERLNEEADSAIDWLNEQETRPFLYWANEGEANAFGLWPNVDGAKEDCGFTSSKSNECPPEDYRGEWLHVSDHGNATLYVREDDGPGSDDSYQDEEIWSCV